MTLGDASGQSQNPQELEAEEACETLRKFSDHSALKVEMKCRRSGRRGSNI